MPWKDKERARQYYRDYRKRALQVDHVHGGGTKELKEKGRVWVYNNVFKEPERYQLLCANCNWIKRYENKEYC